MRGREQRPDFDRLLSFKYSRVTVLIARWTRVTAERIVQADRPRPRPISREFIARLLKIRGRTVVNARVNRNETRRTVRALWWCTVRLYVASSRSFDSLLLSKTCRLGDGIPVFWRGFFLRRRKISFESIRYI